jgi:tetratricopeptide (TPR) repeat protein
MLAALARYDDALAQMDEAARASGTKENLLPYFFDQLNNNGRSDAVLKIAAAHPERMAGNAEAHLNLARAYLKDGRAREALPLLKRAVEIKKDYDEARVAMAEAYRKLHNWTAALASANAAIQIDEENSEAQYHRACALARLRRAKEALAALSRAVELDEYLIDGIEQEQDLKSISRLPGFIKLMHKAEDENK